MGDLTDEQAEFLKHDPKRSGRLLAGPGAGKSFTCVAYLQKRAAGDEPPRIRMLTFTRAAAAEFAQTMTDQKVTSQAPNTIHSFALRILRESRWAGIPQPVRIADTWETRQLVHPQISRLLRVQGHDQATPSKVESLEREMAAGFESLAAPLESEHNPALRLAYLGLWEQHRGRLGYLLRSELPYRATMAIEDIGVPNLGVDLLLVDEYQDLNKADIKLLHLVADAGIAVVAIGDEDQSIYGWRHAAPEGIRGFLEEFETNADYQLTKSRRCGAAILNASQDLIEMAPGRQRKPRMVALDENKPGVVAYLRFPNQHAEAQAVASVIAARVAAGVPPRKIAILARTSVAAWERSMRDVLTERGISIASDAWVAKALEDSELLRLRAMATLAMSPGDSLAWMTLLHLTDGVGAATLDALYAAIRPGETFAGVVVRILTEGVPNLQGARLARARGAISAIQGSLPEWQVPEQPPEGGWGPWLEAKARSPLGEEAKRLLDLVSGKVPADVGLAGFLPQMEMLGKDFALAEQDAVRFITMMSSKGITVDTAIIVGVEDGNIPQPPPKGDPEEERRLLYVGMTRATDYLIMTLCQYRRGPIARRGRENLQARVRSPLLNGVIDPQDGGSWLAAQGWT